MRGRISPNFDEAKLDDPSNADVIDVLEDRIRGWILEPAQNMAESDSGHLPALTLLLTYFKGIWSYLEARSSQGQSKKFFVAAFADVFASSGTAESLLIRVAEVLYSDARCGLFHDGMARNRIYVGTIAPEPLVITLPRVDGEVNLDGELQSLLINSKAFCDSIEQHLSTLVARLRSDLQSPETKRFVEFCRETWSWHTDAYPIGLTDPFDPQARDDG